MNEYLQFNNICKSFPGVKALDQVSFGVSEGSVHALLGENGAGKSTLLKILSGAYTPTSGQLGINGTPTVFTNTHDALKAGISVIYQELQLVPDMTVAENLFIGRYPLKKGLIDKPKMIEESKKLLARLGEDIDPRVKLGSLPIGQRQMVEIAKALGRDAKIIAFDEPTSSLSSREVGKLFAVVEELKRQGKVVLYVTHRMDEVFALCDTITVLRDGQHVQTLPLQNVTRDMIVSLMVGREITDIYGYQPRQVGEDVLVVNNLSGPGLKAPVSFSVKRGEVLGFFGLVGAGRSELMKLVYSAVKRTGGTVSVNPGGIVAESIPASIRAGLVFCSEDRKKEGVIPIRSVMENVNISGRRHFNKYKVLIDSRKEVENTKTYVERLTIRTPSINQLLGNLSGGNQQKVLLARWLCENINAIILDEPTRGIDVGAKREIYDIVFELAETGIGVVIVSSELPEILGICDRIIVMCDGLVEAEISRDKATQELILHHALPKSEVPVN